MIPEIENLPRVSFIDDITLEKIQASLVADYKEKYESLTKKKSKLTRADPVSLILYACSVQLYQVYLFIDRAGKQDLLKYSYGEFLDNIAALKGIKREGAKPAVVTVSFILSEARPDRISIPVGTRVTNGEIYFETTEYAEVQAGDTYIEIPCTCQVAGKEGNGLLPGEINVLVDPIPYMGKVVNVETSSGGASTEDDESLAGRVYIAPSRYSVAGPGDAYRYWIKTFNTSISDAYVGSENPGEVIVEFILNGGELPNDAMIESLKDFLMDENIRPLTDAVIVKRPDIVPYDIKIEYYINKSDQIKANTIQRGVPEAVQNFIEWQQSKIGRDINPSQLTKMVQEAGAKRLVITSPDFTAIPDTSIGRVEKVSITYGGIEDD